MPPGNPLPASCSRFQSARFRPATIGVSGGFAPLGSTSNLPQGRITTPTSSMTRVIDRAFGASSTPGAWVSTFGAKMLAAPRWSARAY